jgi:predicted hotdog family 3-hydroxylacyl-ACP dehydratase
VCPFLLGRRFPAFLLIECAAQAVAAAVGAEAVRRGEPIREGYLVGLKEFRVERDLSPGEVVVVRGEETMVLGEIRALRVEAFCGEERVAGGEMRFYLPETAA